MWILKLLLCWLEESQARHNRARKNRLAKTKRSWTDKTEQRIITSSGIRPFRLCTTFNILQQFRPRAVHTGQPGNKVYRFENRLQQCKPRAIHTGQLGSKVHRLENILQQFRPRAVHTGQLGRHFHRFLIVCHFKQWWFTGYESRSATGQFVLCQIVVFSSFSDKLVA